MQKRHQDRFLYFKELATTSEDFFIPYLRQYTQLSSNSNILEIGCGEGGNLLPFAKIGCHVTGLDISSERIAQAKSFFHKEHALGEFFEINFCLDISKLYNKKFDIIFIHDVIEHIPMKDEFFSNLSQISNASTLIFWGFPSWPMPFGGHQQICTSKLAITPFIHLLPKTLYKKILELMGESPECISELLSIKDTRMYIHSFEKYNTKNTFEILDKTFWFINPHYKQKFNLPPLKLSFPFNTIPGIKDVCSTSCFYITKKKTT